MDCLLEDSRRNPHNPLFSEPPEDLPTFPVDASVSISSQPFSSFETGHAMQPFFLNLSYKNISSSDLYGIFF